MRFEHNYFFVRCKLCFFFLDIIDEVHPKSWTGYIFSRISSLATKMVKSWRPDRRSYFSASGKIALMVLKAYTGSPTAS